MTVEPGQFVAVDLELYVQQGVVLVPTTAVQTGQDGQFVFVVSPDRTAVVHPVRTHAVNEQAVFVRLKP